MNPCVGEIRAVGFNFPPANWHLCDGTLLSVSDYEALFTLLGTTYGGDGQTTFGVPDLRGRFIMNQGTGVGLSPRALGQNGGTEYVPLTSAQMGAHTHTAMASTNVGSTHIGTGAFLAAPVDTTVTTTTIAMYVPDSIAGKTVIPLSPSTITSIGGAQQHENRMPYMPCNYIISLFGIYPSPV
jgi:microcystin-dependent protein